MQKIINVALREFLATVTTKGFILGVLIMPMMMLVVVTLLPKLSSQVELKVNGQHVRTIHFHGEEFVNTTVFPPPGADVCRFEVIPDSLLGSTQFQFVRN